MTIRNPCACKYAPFPHPVVMEESHLSDLYVYLPLQYVLCMAEERITQGGFAPSYSLADSRRYTVAVLTLRNTES